MDLLGLFGQYPRKSAAIQSAAGARRSSDRAAADIQHCMWCWSVKHILATSPARQSPFE